MGVLALAGIYRPTGVALNVGLPLGLMVDLGPPRSRNRCSRRAAAPDRPAQRRADRDRPGLGAVRPGARSQRPVDRCGPLVGHGRDRGRGRAAAQRGLLRDPAAVVSDRPARGLGLHARRHLRPAGVGRGRRTGLGPKHAARARAADGGAFGPESSIDGGARPPARHRLADVGGPGSRAGCSCIRRCRRSTPAEPIAADALGRHPPVNVAGRTDTNPTRDASAQ